MTPTLSYFPLWQYPYFAWQESQTFYSFGSYITHQCGILVLQMTENGMNHQKQSISVADDIATRIYLDVAAVLDA